MLPDLKLLICGVAFGLLLLAVAGAGVVLPDQRTRVGEAPAIGRPMMQRMMAEEPARAQFYITTVVRRRKDQEQLRDSTSPRAASTPTELDLLKLTVVADPVPGGVLAEDLKAPTLAHPPPFPSSLAEEGWSENVSTIPKGSTQGPPTQIGNDVKPDFDQAPLAAPPASADSSLDKPAPHLTELPLPRWRRIANMRGIHRGVVPRRHRVAHMPYPTIVQRLLTRPLHWLKGKSSRISRGPQARTSNGGAARA